jgi:hypothetical protein
LKVAPVVFASTAKLLVWWRGLCPVRFAAGKLVNAWLWEGLGFKPAAN